MWKKPIRTKEWPGQRPANGFSRESAPSNVLAHMEPCSSYGCVLLYFMYIFIWNKAISFQLTVPTWATSSRRPRHMPAHTHPWYVYIFKFLLFWADNRQLNGPGQSGSAWAGATAAAIATAIAIKQISPSDEYYTTAQHRRYLNQKRNWGKLQTQAQRRVLSEGLGTVGRRQESDKLMRALRKWQSALKNTDGEWTKLGKNRSSRARKGLVREMSVVLPIYMNRAHVFFSVWVSNWTNRSAWLRPGLKICPRPLASHIRPDQGVASTQSRGLDPSPRPLPIPHALIHSTLSPLSIWVSHTRTH